MFHEVGADAAVSSDLPFAARTVMLRTSSANSDRRRLRFVLFKSDGSTSNKHWNFANTLVEMAGYRRWLAGIVQLQTVQKHLWHDKGFLGTFNPLQHAFQTRWCYFGTLRINQTWLSHGIGGSCSGLPGHIRVKAWSLVFDFRCLWIWIVVLCCLFLLYYSMQCWNENLLKTYLVESLYFQARDIETFAGSSAC